MSHSVFIRYDNSSNRAVYDHGHIRLTEEGTQSIFDDMQSVSVIIPPSELTILHGLSMLADRPIVVSAL